MEVILAKSAGFCFGVKLALDCVYNNVKKINVCTYGPIIHNKLVVQNLDKLGVSVIDNIDNIDQSFDGKVIIRSHGVPPAIYAEFKKKNIEYIDCTCPFVKKIHKITAKKYLEGNKIIIIGNKEHPEIIGINGYCDNKSIIVNNLLEVNELDIKDDIEYVVVVQTTYDIMIFEDIINALNHKENVTIFNTICGATNERQKEALEISKKVDYMIVLGDTNSANSNKLYEICKKNCKNTYFCETIHNLQLKNLNKNVKIGITAGASTPPAIIKEALNKMSEIEMSFEEMLDASFKTLHNGSVVKGSVIRVTENEIVVNLGYKADGIIDRSEYSNDSNLDLRTQVAVDDEIEVFVVKVNDGDGNVVLSKKRLEMNKGFEELEEAFNNKVVLQGTIIDVIKGGFIANINNIKVFVPSSQISNKFVQNLDEFKGKELDFHIIEFNRAKRRIIAGRRELAQAKENVLKAKIYENIKAGDKIIGKVSRIVDFGAFVDLGGIDGLIHISELSWGRVKNVGDVLREGQEVNAYILEVDPAKNKISLSLKDADKNPWTLAKDKYQASDIIDGKVVRLVSFGAFVEIEEGIDGLVHISQICQKHILKPEEVLSIGEIVKAKITEIDTENKKISLSMKELDDNFEEDNETEQE